MGWSKKLDAIKLNQEGSVRYRKKNSKILENIIKDIEIEENAII